MFSKNIGVKKLREQFTKLFIIEIQTIETHTSNFDLWKTETFHR